MERFATDRGGDITYHGPGQVVGYPVLRLPGDPRGVRSYVDGLVEVVVRACADFGVRAVPGGRGRTGVWVGDDKVGALGVRVHRGVATHGFALNVATDLEMFSLIVPCGLADARVTSLSRLAGPEVTVSWVEARLAHHAGEVLGLAPEEVPPEWESVQVVVWRRGPDGEREVLVLERTAGRGGFRQPVTGRVEPGETPRQTAAREVWEETGLAPDGEALEDLGYVHAFLIEPWTRPLDEAEVHRAARGALFCREHSFAWEAPPDAGVRLGPDEHVSAAWLPLPEALDAMVWRGNVRALELVGRAG